MPLSEPETAVNDAGRIARVVVEVEPFHLDRPFDYLVGEHDVPVTVGSRVEVVFSGRRRRGLVIGLADETEVEASRLRAVRKVLGPHAWVAPDDIDVLRWAADRFGAPLADVVRHALPGRTVAVEAAGAEAGWFPPAVRPRPVVDTDLVAARAAADSAWADYGDAGAELVARCTGGRGAHVWRPLPGADVGDDLAELVCLTLAAGRDVLVVTPDAASRAARRIVERARAVLGRDEVVDVRGQTGPRATYRGWLRARCGVGRLVLGERGVAFWPLQELGLAVVLDEANPALKERRSPRHHAREVVLERARRAEAVGLLVTTVPSAATWRLLRERRLQPVTAPRATERDRAPQVVVDDERGGPRTRFGRRAVPEIRRAVADGTYAVVLAARGGRGAALLCSSCGHMHRCPNCGSSVRSVRAGWGCSVCGWEGRAGACPECRTFGTVPLAAGATQLGEEIARTVQAPVAVLEGHDQDVPPAPAVLVTTRGSVMDAAPGRVGVVVLADLDALARRPSIDAPEDALRLAMAVSNWAAAATPSAPVVVHTREASSPVVQALVQWDAGGFWRAEAGRREALGFPPARHAISLESPQAHVDDVLAVLDQAFPIGAVLGPMPADRGWARILLLVDDRVAALAALADLRADASRAGRELRVDVDPVALG